MSLILILDTNYFDPLTMLYLAMFTLLAWGTFLPVAAAAETQQLAVGHETNSPVFFEQGLAKRRANNASACKAYGVDYQDGGNYFVDQRSTELFQAVTLFEGYVRSAAAVFARSPDAVMEVLCAD